MLGRKTYEQEELDHARSDVDAQLAAYRKLASATPAKAKGALAEFEPLFFNNLALALDRYFVHRIRSVTGKDNNPLNELELICDSLLNNGAIMRGNNVIKYVPETSVVKLVLGDPITLTETDFTALSTAFLAEIEARFVQT